MRSRLFGTSAIAAASFLRVAIQILMFPVIGRLLGPVAFGQIALVSPFILFAMLLSESGLGACIVRADHVSPQLEGTVFCFAAGFGLLTIALFAAIAHPIGRLVQEPTFPALLLAMSSILFLSSFSIVPAAQLVRDHRYKWIALSDLASSLGGVAALGLGIIRGWGVWSLLAQQVGFWICKTAMVTLGARKRPLLIFDWGTFKQHFHFGSDLTGAGIVKFIASNTDNLLIGAFLGTKALGFYVLAWQIDSLPAMIFGGSVYLTLFSGTSEMRRSGTFSPKPFLRTLKAILLISAPFTIGLAVTAPLSIALILGDKWLGSVPIVTYLATWGLCQIVGAAISSLLIGLGLSAVSLRLSVIASLATISAILIGVFISSETHVVAAGISVAAVFEILIMLRAVTKACSISGSDLLRVFFPPLTAAGLMGTLVYACQNLVALNGPIAIRLGLCIFVGIASYAVILFALFQKEIAEDLRILRTIIRSDFAKETP
jgi:O-antigen/teichoic acid export membrane protein